MIVTCYHGPYYCMRHDDICTGFDSDEMALSMDGSCIIDLLPNYNGYNGLMLPW
jgi:hypothetical protein